MHAECELRFSARALSVPRVGVSGCDGAQCPQVPEGDVWTKSALEVKLTHSALLAATVEYCKEHNCGGKKAANAPEFSGKSSQQNRFDYARAYYPDTERNKYQVEISV